MGCPVGRVISLKIFFSGYSTDSDRMAYMDKHGNLRGFAFRDIPTPGKSSGGKKRRVTRRTKVPIRFRTGKVSYRKNIRMARLSPMAERKLSPFTDQNEVASVPIAVGAQAYKYTVVLGNAAPSTWGGFNPLAGFNFPAGTGLNQRDGRYMWLDKSTINMSVHMNPDTALGAPVQFRMVIFRARRVTTPTGVSYDPNLRLFLKPNGDGFGAGTAGTTFNDLYLQPTNKRDWIIIRDQRFTLSPLLRPSTTETAAWQGKYANFKMVRINLPHKIKSSFSNASNEPDDYDFHYGIAIYAGRIGRDQNADDWEVNLRGTTSALDN